MSTCLLDSLLDSLLSYKPIPLCAILGVYSLFLLLDMSTFYLYLTPQPLLFMLYLIMPLSKVANRERMRDARQKQNGQLPTVQPSERQFAGSKHILSKKDRLERLSVLALGNDKLANPVEALKEMSKLLGEYPPIQHNVAGKVIFEVVHVDRKQLPTEQEPEAIETTGQPVFKEGEDDAPDK